MIITLLRGFEKEKVHQLHSGGFNTIKAIQCLNKSQ